MSVIPASGASGPPAVKQADATTSSKSARAAFSLLVYGLLLAVVNVAHARLFSVDVVFYGALLDAAVAAAATGAAMQATRLLAPLNAFERAQLAVVWLMCGYVFAISVPTVIDRSLSIYLLEKIEQRGGAIPVGAIEGVIATDYLREQRVADVRLTEQLASGTVTRESGCLVLTDRGRRIARFSRFYRANFLPRSRRLVDDYSSGPIGSIGDVGVGSPQACIVSATGRPATKPRVSAPSG